MPRIPNDSRGHLIRHLKETVPVARVRSVKGTSEWIVELKRVRVRILGTRVEVCNDSRTVVYQINDFKSIVSEVEHANI